MNARSNVESLRLPPHSIEAEQAVLGGLLLSNAALDRIADLLSEKDFYRQDHRVIWRAIVKIVGDNKPADVLTVFEALKGDLQEIGGLPYLHGLATGVSTAANIRSYAETVRETAIIRRLAEVGTAIADSAYNSHGRGAQALLNDAEGRILAVGEKGGKGDQHFVGMSPILAQVMSKLDDLHKNPQSVTGLGTGFVDLDEITAGLQPTDLIVIAGRPSMGKTALAMNIAEYAAVDLKKPVLVFSMEMGNAQLGRRLLSSVGKVDSHKIRTGKLSPLDWDRLGGALGKLNEAPLEIDETGALTPMEMRARARRKWREYGGLGLIVVDYLQLMQSGDGKTENRATEIGDITRSLKMMAKELNCPVIALSQLNRDLEKRVNKRPVMSDLRESGAIEQDADVIVFVYRDEVYNEESPDKGIAEIIIGKQRSGSLGTVRLTFINRYTRFENYSGAPGY